MAEATQFTFELREITEALIRKQGLKEGKWAVSFEMNLGVGVFGGPTPNEALPGALIQVARAQLIRPRPNDPHLAWTVDAEELAEKL